MKILLSLILLALSVNANEVIYGSLNGQLEPTAINGENVTSPILELDEGELLEILRVTGAKPREGQSAATAYISILSQHGNQLPVGIASWTCSTYNSSSGSEMNSIKQLIVGPCKILVTAQVDFRTTIQWQVSYKLTKPSAANTTTSAPILLPPTQDIAKSWLVNLQVSNDLKIWEDVAPGQFLGSDTARFFRIKTTESE
ncbi:hypothetical protein N9W62_03275 [Akkermansiaceae bacterium]|nr:hypothetical protein [Akkermansiaceae bacterium]